MAPHSVSKANAIIEQKLDSVAIKELDAHGFGQAPERSTTQPIEDAYTGLTEIPDKQNRLDSKSWTSLGTKTSHKRKRPMLYSTNTIML